ncbi:hypothetical protein [Candidatus Villigracilis affinis]|uniref:hypothetical protein n=1 Tax=Candidatus Villigracilis affinis TaxID=3140682 RepID=UPI0031ED3328
MPITARLVADMLEVAGADRYMTSTRMRVRCRIFSIPSDVLTASHLLVGHINRNMRQDMKDPAVVSVDLGFAKRDATTPQIWICPSPSSKNAAMEMTPTPKH